MKPCIVLCANTSWYLYNYRQATIAALQQQGYQVICVAPSDAYSQRLQEATGADYHELKMDNQGSHPLSDALLMLRLWRLYRKLRPSVVLHFTIKNNLYGTLAASLLGIPAVNNVSGLGTAFMHAGITQQIVRLLYRVSQPRAFAVFCQNSEDHDFLIREDLVPAQKLRRIPGSGVDIERFSPRPISKPEARPFRFLFLGRMLKDKGVYELIEAFTRLQQSQPAELWLVGFSDAANNSAIGAQQLKQWDSLPGITWFDATDQPEEFLAQSDCLVLPSYREGLPRSLLEAGAMQIPVIACNVPGSRQVVEHGRTGLLCAPADSDSLHQALLEMSTTDANQRQQMGIAARQHVAENYSQQLVVTEYLAAITAALAEDNQAI
ncbi:glycosyltransferase family 1 protein [Halieaceae bacterium IMCC14734]|uniref:Glycosyltransferase family 1 protein n=1 Tax=Candidatus Litorirhabdus singularis TaxID=2518993 RepID=A0ABT3TDJ1_9GAMM|nr:glycosyltransferase family 4 protein [Candidatus Litorirhabdus singularis]MCX2980380.1 glycosyltransferase family 1 protein [Candidatus Litorirhabdus singularis]